jgi:HlyD family secretion protein
MTPVKGKKLTEIELRSEPVQEILGTVPPWIIRWGITLFLIIIILILFGSWFFKYPDFINAEIEVITQNPPAEIIAKSTGKIDQFFIDDKNHVQEGEKIAIIENPANTEEVFHLKNELENIKPYIFNGHGKAIPDFEYGLYNNLGEIQSYYSLFLKSYLDYDNFLKVDFHNQKIKALDEQLSDQSLHYQYSYDQRITLEEDYNLALNDYERHRKLFENGAIAEVELEKKKSEMLEKKSDLQAARTNLSNIEIDKSKLEEQKLDYKLQYLQDSSTFKLNLRESFENLVSQIDIWEQKYVIEAPISGIATFNRFWTENQNVVAGEKVVSIVPYDSTNIIGKMLMPIKGSGKVKVGQKVNIKFYNYPYMEFGMVSGEIKNISTVPADNLYSVEVKLPEGLKTNYGIELDFNQKMKGIGEIITEDIRFIVRVIRPIRSIIQNRSVKEIEPPSNEPS